MRGAFRHTILHHIIPEGSKTTIHEAVTDKLGHRKLCARWVPRMSTDDHKTKWIGSSLKFLTRYAQGDEFLDSIVTGDVTWVSHHTPESKQWSHMHSPRTKILTVLWIGATISNTSHSYKAESTIVKQARLTSKGSRSTAVLP